MSDDRVGNWHRGREQMLGMFDTSSLIPHGTAEFLDPTEFATPQGSAQFLKCGTARRWKTASVAQASCGSLQTARLVGDQGCRTVNVPWMLPNTTYILREIDSGRPEIDA
jgi:hypothetical protein